MNVLRTNMTAIERVVNVLIHKEPTYAYAFLGIQAMESTVQVRNVYLR